MASNSLGNAHAGNPTNSSQLSKKPSTPSRSRYRSLGDPETLAKFAQNLGEGIYITNEAGDFLDANPAFLKIFGVGRSTS